MRNLIKADVQRLTPDQLVGKAGYIVGAMTLNAAFPAPSPTLPVVTAAQQTLIKAIKDAESFSRVSIAAKKVAAEALRELLSDLASYVNQTAGKDLNVALSSGFEQAKTPAPIEVKAPASLNAVTSETFGAADLHWSRVQGARMYNVYMTEGEVNDNSVWKVVATTTRTRKTVGGLKRSNYFSFMVTAMGANNESAASPTSTAKAA
jgi:hypothetical protein